jgi:para-aminobenzoate synthetase component 1
MIKYINYKKVDKKAEGIVVNAEGYLLKEVSTQASAIEIYEMFCLEPNSAILDSNMNAGEMGRYSFIVHDPFLTFASKGRKVIITKETGVEIIEDTDPLKELRQLLKKYKMPRHPELPPFLGGAVGYFSYDLGYLLEKLPRKSVDDHGIPDIYLGFYDTVVIMDHQEHKTYLASTGFPETEDLKRRIRAEQRLQRMETRLLHDRENCSTDDPPFMQGAYSSNFTRDQYCAIVEKAKDYIMAGDIFQVNLSQRLCAKIVEPPFSLYKRLRSVSPAPFACYLNMTDVIVASASPERLLSLQGNVVETRPIKGTRPRSQDPILDAQLRDELWASEKDRAELVMIIDLERNDLGRVCNYGTVKVPDLIRMEEYATVFHLVATVTGELEGDKDIVDLLKATFPGGSITGAPKIRAMEIIDEIEPFRRGIYTGSIGYIDFSGDADLNIAIRTFVIKDGLVHFQVGGGIVADSDPDMEYEETLHKARGLLEALGNGRQESYETNND